MDGAAVPDPAADALPVARLGSRSLGAGFAAVVAAVLAGLAIGPVNISLTGVALELLDQLPLVDVDSGLSPVHQAIVVDIRLSRVVLGLSLIHI